MGSLCALLAEGFLQRAKNNFLSPYHYQTPLLDALRVPVHEDEVTFL